MTGATPPGGRVLLGLRVNNEVAVADRLVPDGEREDTVEDKPARLREVRRLKRNTLATLKEPLTGIGAAVDAVGGSFTMAYTAVVVTADIRTAGRRVREPGRCSHSG